MSTLLITYDLLQSGQNYARLIEKIKSYRTWCHLQQSVWLISTDSTCVQVRGHLSESIDSNDKLFVAKLGEDAAWIGYQAQISKWIKETV